MAITDGPIPSELTPKSICPECGRWEVCDEEITKNLWFYRTKTIKVCYYCKFDRLPYHEEEYQKWLKT